jgi:tetratricopeptide (TPR) repeat protein
MSEMQKRIDDFLASAVTRINGHDYAGSIEELKAAEVLDPENPVILYNLGVSYSGTGLHNTAISYFNKILELPLQYVDILSLRKLLAYSHIMLSQPDKAMDHIDTCLSVAKRDIAALSMKGYCLEHTGKHEDAEKTFEEILLIEPDNINACNSLAYLIAKRNGDLNKALKYAKKAHNVRQDNPSYLDTMGYVYLKRGQSDMAKNFLKKALNLLPDSDDIRRHVKELLKLKNEDK